jgi:hypothetical protein
LAASTLPKRSAIDGNRRGIELFVLASRHKISDYIH